MMALLMRAYGLKRYQISAPAWVDSDRYQIQATVQSGTGMADAALMLRLLLAERFHLAARQVTAQVPIYALVVAKGGAKLMAADARPGDEGAVTAPKIVAGPDGLPQIAPGTKAPRSYQILVGGPDGARFQLWARKETMEQLADRLSSQLERPVIDRTGLQGRYDFSLTWVMERAGGGIPRTDPPPDMIEQHNIPVTSDPALNLFVAIQRQLGLKLKAAKGPVKMLIVEKLDRTPTPD